MDLNIQELDRILNKKISIDILLLLKLLVI